MLSIFGFLGNPLATVVLPEPLANGDLAGAVSDLKSQGVALFSYPLTLQLVQPRSFVGAFNFGITGPPGVYSVFTSTNFMDWTPLESTTNTVGALRFTDTTAHFSSRKFYRLSAPAVQ
jgi:hypothetical protein